MASADCYLNCRDWLAPRDANGIPLDLSPRQAQYCACTCSGKGTRAPVPRDLSCADPDDARWRYRTAPIEYDD